MNTVELIPTRLTETIGPLEKANISLEFWGNVDAQCYLGDFIDLESFWRYYNRMTVYALNDNGRSIAARTHYDIIEVVRLLRAGVGKEEIQNAVRYKLKESHVNAVEMLENYINLSATLLLMCDCGSLRNAFSGRTVLNWKRGPLREHLAEVFAGNPALKHENTRLDKDFVAKNIVEIAGIEIIWTDNLLDHLRLTDDDTKVHVFHHASFLEQQVRSNESLLPDGLAAETLRTLALLLPMTDHKTQKWFSRSQSTMKYFPPLDRRAVRCGQLKAELRQIEQFRFWRDKLVLLKQVFDEAEPRTLGQWWRDRRSGVQWYTFWVAIVILILTIFFGLVQSIEGAIQVYASLKALESSG